MAYWNVLFFLICYNKSRLMMVNANWNMWRCAMWRVCVFFVYDKHLYFLRYSRKENICAHSQLSDKRISLQIREIYKNAMGLTCKSEINSEFTRNDCYLLRSQSLQLSRIFGDNVHRSSCCNRLTATAHEQIMCRQRKHNANIFFQNEAT
jgi:hypothetical protein